MRRTQQILLDVTAELALGGTGLEELQGLECQLYVHPHGGVTPMLPAGSMVLIPQWLTVRSARRCAFTGKMTAVVFQQASKSEIVAHITSTSSVVHLVASVFSATVALNRHKDN